MVIFVYTSTKLHWYLTSTLLGNNFAWILSVVGMDSEAPDCSLVWVPHGLLLTVWAYLLQVWTLAKISQHPIAPGISSFEPLLREPILHDGTSPLAGHNPISQCRFGKMLPLEKASATLSSSATETGASFCHCVWAPVCCNDTKRTEAWHSTGFMFSCTAVLWLLLLLTCWWEGSCASCDPGTWTAITGVAMLSSGPSEHVAHTHPATRWHTSLQLTFSERHDLMAPGAGTVCPSACLCHHRWSQFSACPPPNLKLGVVLVITKQNKN